MSCIEAAVCEGEDDRIHNFSVSSCSAVKGTKISNFYSDWNIQKLALIFGLENPILTNFS